MVYSSPKVELSPTKLSKNTVFPVHLFVQCNLSKRDHTLQTVLVTAPPSKHQNIMSVLTSWRAAVEADWRALEAAPKELRSERQVKLRQTDQKMVEIGCRWDYCLSNHAWCIPKTDAWTSFQWHVEVTCAGVVGEQCSREREAENSSEKPEAGISVLGQKHPLIILTTDHLRKLDQINSSEVPFACQNVSGPLFS